MKFQTQLEIWAQKSFCCVSEFRWLSVSLFLCRQINLNIYSGGILHLITKFRSSENFLKNPANNPWIRAWLTFLNLDSSHRNTPNSTNSFEWWLWGVCACVCLLMLDRFALIFTDKSNDVIVVIAHAHSHTHTHSVSWLRLWLRMAACVRVKFCRFFPHVFDRWFNFFFKFSLWAVHSPPSFISIIHPEICIQSIVNWHIAHHVYVCARVHAHMQNQQLQYNLHQSD